MACSDKLVTKSDIQHTVLVLSQYIESENNGYTKSMLEHELKRQKRKLTKWDDTQLILDEFVRLVQSHNVYSETFDIGYGDGSDTTWFIDDEPLVGSIRFLDVDFCENYDILITETDKKIDRDTIRTHYSYQMEANDDDNK